MSQQGIYVPIKACFRAKLAVFGPNILIILGGQKFWYPHIRKPPRHLVHIVFFGREWHIMDQIKTNGRSTKNSSPTPLWGHRLTVTALALSARRPFGPKRFVRGLDNGCQSCQTSYKICFRYRSIDISMLLYRKQFSFFFLFFLFFIPFIKIGWLVGVWVGGILYKGDQEPRVFLYISDND